jgi:DNA-directed RNA polymerase specialized sigma24 family protein
LLEGLAPYLTGRQRRALNLRLHGYTMKEISRFAHSSATTVERDFQKMREQIPARCVV